MVEKPHEKVLKILHIEDDEDDRIIIKSMLTDVQGQKMDLTSATTFEEGRRMLSEGNYHAVLIDYDLGSSTGIDLIREVTSQGKDIPMILLTGRGSYAVDVEAMRAGASLYLTKKEINPLLLERAIRYAIERKQSEVRLRLSEEKFSAVFAQSPTPTFMETYPDEVFVDVNQAYLKLIGFERSEVIGKTRFELGIITETKGRQFLMDEINKKGCAREFETIKFSKNGRQLITNSTLEIISIDGRKYILGTAEDVTEQKRAEQALIRSKELAQQRLNEIEEIYRNAPIGLCLLDKELRWVRINDWLARMNGFSPAEHIGKTVRELIPATADAVEESFREILATGIPKLNVEVTDTDLKGRHRVWQANWLPVKDHSGATQGINIVVEDITKRKEAERELRESKEQYQRIVENANEGIWVSDENKIARYVNNRMAEMIGYRPEEILGRTFEDFMDEEGRVHAHEVWERRKQGSTEVNIQ